MGKHIFSAPLFFLFLSCFGYSWGTLTINPGVHNAGEINSINDDYNITAPPSYSFDYNVIYSTNIMTNGGKFDVWSGNIKLNISHFDKEFSLKSDRNIPYKNELNLPESNEFGPLTMGEYYFFTSDRSGDLDIYMYSNSDKKVYQFFGNNRISDEGYITFDKNNKSLYFCSNKDGNYDIYRLSNIDYETPFEKWFSDVALIPRIVKVDELNSFKDDKFPYIFENMIIFSSDRSEGKGGFDIYYSKILDGNIQAPINMKVILDGEVKSKHTTYSANNDKYSINTSSNEFRPSLYYSNKSFGYDRNIPKNKILLFSSDRSGGKGGIDIYLAILPSEF